MRVEHSVLIAPINLTSGVREEENVYVPDTSHLVTLVSYTRLTSAPPDRFRSEPIRSGALLGPVPDCPRPSRVGRRWVPPLTALCTRCLQARFIQFCLGGMPDLWARGQVFT